jgi:ABC-2 type transport system permease protein
MKKYFKVFWQLAKISLMNQMAYRPSFFLAVFGKIFRIAFLLAFFKVIYLNVESIAGWDFNEILVLVATYSTVEFIASITFRRNLFYQLPYLIRRGDFDFILTKPINSLFYSSMRIIDMFDLTSFIPVLILWGYIVMHLEKITMMNVFLFLLLLGNALILVFALTVIFSSIAFWTFTGVGAGRLFENVLRITQYPTDIFNKPLKIALSYIIPVSLVATFPAKSLFGLLSWQNIISSLSLTTLLLFFSLKFWNFALKRYTSASS